MSFDTSASADARSRAFEIFILSMMQCDELRNRALAQLAVSREELLRSQRDVAGPLGVLPNELSFFEQYLGAPARVEERGATNKQVRRLLYFLRSWPQFPFVLTVADDRTVASLAFERDSRGARAEPDAPALEAWQMVEGDLSSMFDQYRKLDEWFPVSGYECVTRDQPRTHLRLVFVLGLLQVVEITTPASPNSDRPR